MTVIASIVAWLALCTAALAVAFRRVVAAAWREPVLRRPVLILESDDWGYGPVEQAQTLRRIADVLARFRDDTGRHPVMTLGVILAGPDTAAMRALGVERYRRLTVADEPLVAVRAAMLEGAECGVFALQLHGREHYWPDCVMRAAADRQSLRAWLTSPGIPRTEQLPSELQSRWMDAVALPSRPLPADRVRSEAAAEVGAFADTFGRVPDVAVPPTFAWTRDVEDAWALAGVRTIVTPGRRSESRDANGRFVYDDAEIRNGDLGKGDCLLLVRDVYFEPALGHDHRRAAADVVARTRLARPALLEIHRMNFLPPGAAADRALDEIDRLIGHVRALLPDVRFMSTSELAEHYRNASDLFDKRLVARVHFLLRRLSGVTRLRKLAWITGAIVPAWVAYTATCTRLR
jgi:hypothetical protein